jgi:hypothetical protein
VNFNTLNIKKMAKLQQHKSSRGSSSRIKSNSSSRKMKQLKPQRAATQDALEMEVFEDAPVADLDTPVVQEGPDETGPGDEITDPDPEEEMQVGDIQDESQDAMPEDPGV